MKQADGIIWELGWKGPPNNFLENAIKIEYLKFFIWKYYFFRE